MPDELLCGKSGISEERDKNRKQPAGVSVFFVKHFFEKLLKFFELGALRTSQCQLVFFSVYWFFSRASC